MITWVENTNFSLEVVELPHSLQKIGHGSLFSTSAFEAFGMLEVALLGVAHSAPQTFHLSDLVLEYVYPIGRIFERVTKEVHDFNHNFRIFVGFFDRLRSSDVVGIMAKQILACTSA